MRFPIPLLLLAEKLNSTILFFCTGLVLLSNITKAQDTSHKTKDSVKVDDHRIIELGVSGGLSLNRFTKEQPQTGYNVGAVAGISAHYNFYKGLGLQIEVNYLQQGGQMITFKDDTRLGLPESFSTKNVKNSSYELNSIEIPLLINYTFDIKKSWKPSLYTGASYAYTFNVTESYRKTGNLLTGEDIIATVNGKQSVTNQFDRNRYNFIVGANLKLPISNRLSLLVDFRYLNGITAARQNYSYMEKVGFGSDVRSNSFLSKIGLILSVR
ncbi:porin family protein [Mucilaginibacter sp. KACC 22063]|uniref:porin family protein n=1 Tax=Mucilaginibacter sp. KACC 22063 TaxID=3025666 RepID=UPI0023659A2A|nr:porin family protein [Mucilaginibacter sp. KACC 22063]WDF54987.1 porin family protein [Mucilaginibacter sp. KACC 22063]